MHLCAAVCHYENKENPTLCNLCCLHSRKAMQQRRHNGRFGIILSKVVRSFWPLNPRNICFGIHLSMNWQNISNYLTNAELICYLHLQTNSYVSQSGSRIKPTIFGQNLAVPNIVFQLHPPFLQSTVQILQSVWLARLDFSCQFWRAGTATNRA